MPITRHIPWSFCPAFSTPSSLACRQRDQYQPVVTAVAPPLGLLLQLIATATGRTFRQQLTLLERSGHPSLSAYNLHFIPCASGLRTGLANVSGLYLNRQAVATIESLIHGNWSHQFIIISRRQNSYSVQLVAWTAGNPVSFFIKCTCYTINLHPKATL